ncbi:hypothetical protein [Frateuria soli]|uniref:hypothetical protein n=1 Tax=Frateuria soli TaxID=1542730 RepID=UPI001E60BD4F|nr:hypothetical protein [Frateuria soli]UGB38294.1 hypothetical protein LQ771_00090 [Frateuria soli]
MRGSLRWLIGSMCALAASCAWAQGGQIHFHGAVVEPTCASVANGVPSPDEVGALPALRYGCGSNATRPMSNSRMFTQTVTRLAANESVPVLKYFNDYVAAGSSGAPRPVLVTRTYE